MNENNYYCLGLLIMERMDSAHGVLDIEEINLII